MLATIGSTHLIGRRRKAGALLAGGLTLALAASGCGGADEVASGGAPGVDTAKKTVNVGGWTIASGAFAGQAAAGRGAETCIAAANEAGGVNGWKFNIKLNDTAGVPTRALQETKNAVEGGQVFSIVWGPGTSSNQSVMPYILGKTMPYQPGMSGDTLLGKDLKNVFPMIPAYSRLGYHLADYAMGDLKGKRIALIFENSGIGQDVQKTLKAYVQSKGGELVAEVPTAADDSDFTPMAIALKKANPDVVINHAGPTALVKTKAALMASGLNVPWVSGYYVASDAVVDLDPATMDGVYFQSYLVPFFSDDPVAAKFREDMKKFAPETKADIQSINGYASCQIFVEGFKAMTDNGGEVTQENLIKAFQAIGTKQIGVNGAITYTPTEHLGNNSAFMVQWKKTGGWSVVQDAKPLPTAP
jgi:branched-chain amino acid transport system substrate-binding protein